MGDVVVSVLVKDVLGKLTSVAINEFGLIMRLKDDLMTLKDDFNEIQAVLHDAEEKHGKEKAIELWLKSLIFVSLKVENLLDEVSTEAMLQRLHVQRGITYRVRAFFSTTHNHLLARTRIAQKVKKLRIQLDAIAAKRLNLNLTLGVISVDIGVSDEIPKKETSSLILSSIVYGRNKDVEIVIEKICNNDTCKHDIDSIPVYAIWGMGGLGKTTLAQLIYNDERVDGSMSPKISKLRS